VTIKYDKPISSRVAFNEYCRFDEPGGLYSGGAYIRGGGAYIWNEVSVSERPAEEAGPLAL
jgi:hypothetical protein